MIQHIEYLIEQFYRSKDWLNVRHLFLTKCKEENTPFKCKLCSVGLYFKTKASNENNYENKRPLNVDHILPVRYNWEKRLDINNLQLLCEECNKIKASNTNEEEIRLRLEARKIEMDIINNNPEILKKIAKESDVISSMHKRFNEEKYTPPKNQPIKFNLNKGFLTKKPKEEKNKITTPLTKDEIEITTKIDSDGNKTRTFKLSRKIF